jgi:hypothetical protein
VINCLTTIDGCQTHSCLNNGIYVNNYGSLSTCHCQSGFIGVSYEVSEGYFHFRRKWIVFRSILMIVNVKQHFVIIMEHVLIKQIVFFNIYVHQIRQV